MKQDSVRHLPAQNPSVETGPTCFGDDKTGVFIRADNALAFSIAIRDLLQDKQLQSVRLAGWKTEMENLLHLLESIRNVNRVNRDDLEFAG